MYVCMCVYIQKNIYIQRDREREVRGGKEGDIYFKKSASAIVEA